MAFWDLFFGKQEPRVYTEEAAHFYVTLQLKDTIRYHIAVSPMDNGCFQFDKGPVTVNGKPTSTYIASDMAAKCGAIIYPLQLDEMFTAVFNHEAIQQRWEEQMPQLKAYFVGDEAVEYIDATGRVLYDRGALMQALRQDHFLVWWSQQNKFLLKGPIRQLTLPVLK